MSTEEIQDSEQQVTEPQTEDIQQEAPEPTPVAEDDDKAFLAGFDAANGIEPEPEPTPAEPEELEFAGYKESQIKELLAKAAEVDRLKERESKIFGTIGSLKQQIEKLSQNPQPSATQVQLTKDHFKRLSEVFPEMADALTEDLQSVFKAPMSAPAQDQQYLSRLEEIQRATEAKILSVMHPDWKKIVPSEDFQNWKLSLDESERTQLDTSWDSAFIGEKLAEFKAWKGKTAQAQETKRARLVNAITPRGQAKPEAQTETDAFYAGFKSAMGQ